jgi:peptidoglycan/xylan/chitin deacetylase (PgdA/CDA1 family)
MKSNAWLVAILAAITLLITGGFLWYVFGGKIGQSSSYSNRSQKDEVVAQRQTDFLDQATTTVTHVMPGHDIVVVSSSTGSSTLSSTSKLPAVQDMQVNFGILMYHYIGDTDPKMSKSAASLHVATENLENQIKYLLDKGYHFVTLSEAYDMFIKTGKTPPKIVVLTFDDGYRSFYTNAFPILKKYKVKASAYIISQDIGRAGNVTWDMLKEISRSGLVEIGAHTVNHKNLKKLSDDDQRFQMGQNKKDLEEGLRIKVTTIVYPFGEHNTSTKQIAKELGFKGGAAVYNGSRPSTKDLYNWRRVQVQNKDVGDELMKVLYTAFESSR